MSTQQIKKRQNLILKQTNLFYHTHHTQKSVRPISENYVKIGSSDQRIDFETFNVNGVLELFEFSGKNLLITASFCCNHSWESNIIFSLDFKFKNKYLGSYTDYSLFMHKCTTLMRPFPSLFSSPNINYFGLVSSRFMRRQPNLIRGSWTVISLD